jgi:predicted RND superfamily exporter protein
MFFQKYKKIIIIIIILLAVLLGYSFISGGSQTSNADPLLVSSNTNTQARIVGNEIISALNQIQTLNLSKDIFEDKVFLSLVDRSEEIAPEPVGKTNPFSPIGSSAVQAPRATTTPRTNSAIINTTNNNAPSTNQPVI